MAAQVARALVHLEAHTILHRDIKPANVLLDECGRPRCHAKRPVFACKPGTHVLMPHAGSQVWRGQACGLRRRPFARHAAARRGQDEARRHAALLLARDVRGAAGSSRRLAFAPLGAHSAALAGGRRGVPSQRGPASDLMCAGQAVRLSQRRVVRRCGRTARAPLCSCRSVTRRSARPGPRTGCGGLAARRGGWRLGSAGSHPAPLSASLVATAGRPRRRLSFRLRVRARRASHRAGCAGAQGAWRTRWRCSRHRTSPAVSPRS